jgi:hypothetical protein
MPKPDHRSQMARAWLHFHAARKGRGSGRAAPRVDRPVYPRRAEHNTVAEAGNRGWAGRDRPENPGRTQSAEINVAAVTVEGSRRQGLSGPCAGRQSQFEFCRPDELQPVCAQGGDGRARPGADRSRADEPAAVIGARPVSSTLAPPDRGPGSSLPRCAFRSEVDIG